MKAVAAFIVAVCSAVVVSISLAYLFGGLSPVIAFCSLTSGAAAGYLLLRGPNADSRPRDFEPWEWFVIICYALFSMRSFFWIAFTDGNEVKFIATNNLGDLSLHLTYINYLANGTAFWPENPIFAGVKLHYPLGADLFNSLLVLCGMNIYRSLVWVGITAAALTGIALYRWGGAFTMAGFLFNGGLIGFKFFRTLKFADYEDAVAWKSIPLALFITQRGLLYAVPAGLLLLWSWRRKFFPASSDAKWQLPAWAEVLIYATLPLFHLHTFIFLSLLLGYWFLTESNLRKKIAVLVGCSLIPGTISVTLITGLFHGASAIWWHPGWMQGDENFFKFWLVNFGILPLLVAWLCVEFIRHRTDESERTGRAFVFPALLIFLLTCFVMFAKWEWDNTKIMLWSYLVILPWLWSQLVARRNLFVRYGICIALFFSGFVSLVGGIDSSHGGYGLAKRTELAGISAAVRGIPISATFASFPTFNNPILLLGRKAVAGYDGHLSSHGIDYGKQLTILKSIMMGEDGWKENARALNARYLFWGEQEREEYKNSREPWKTESMLVAQGSWGAIYDLESPASGSQ